MPDYHNVFLRLLFQGLDCGGWILSFSFEGKSRVTWFVKTSFYPRDLLSKKESIVWHSLSNSPKS